MSIIFAGTVVNTTTIEVDPNDTVVVGDGVTSDAELTGGGTVTLTSGDTVEGFAPNSTLANLNNSIEAVGGVVADGTGGNSIIVNIVNEVDGRIAAVGDGLGNGLLTINASIVNSGELAATNGGRLVLSSAVVDGGGHGIILADGAGSEVVVSDSTIQGTTLATANDGIVRLDTATLDGRNEAVIIDGDVVIAGGDTGTIVGRITNAGQIVLEGPGATLAVGVGSDETATLRGFGVVELTASTSISAATAGSPDARLINVNNAIVATGGTIGDDDGASIDVAVTNRAAGLIAVEGDGAGHGLLTLNEDVVNQGTLIASGGGRLVLNGIEVDGSLGGVIAAGVLDSSDLASEVLIANSTIVGGQLFTDNGGIIEVTDSVFDGSLFGIINAAHVQVGGTHSLTLTGTIANLGEIVLEPGATLTIGEAADTTALVGGGTIQLTSSGTIDGGDAQSRLLNVDNVIIATGGDVSTETGGNVISVNLVNDASGLVAAVGDSADHGLLTLSGAVTNFGTMSAEDGGKLVVDGTLGNFGVLWADDATVEVNAGAGYPTGLAFVTRGGQLHFSANAGGMVAFADGGGTVHLAQADGFVGVLAGAAGSFDLEDVPFNGTPDVDPPIPLDPLLHTAWSSATYFLQYLPNATATGGTLSLMASAAYDILNEAGDVVGGDIELVPDIWSVRVAGQYQEDDFTVTDDGHGGTLITGGTVSSSNWQTGLSGAWLNASRWGSGVPGAWTQAHLDPGTYTVTSSVGTTTYAVSTGDGAQLRIAAGDFWTNEGTGDGVNAGIVSVSAGAAFNVAGQFINEPDGIINLRAGASKLGLYSAYVDNGTIQMATGSIVDAATFTSTLHGVTVVGRGTIQASLGATLAIIGTDILATAITIRADGSAGPSKVFFGDTYVQNAVLTAQGAGSFATIADTESAFSNVTIDVGTTVGVVGNSELILAGRLTNNGLLDVGDTSAASITLGGNTTFAGSGTITLHDSTIGSFDDSSAIVALINGSVILGSGQVGDDGMRLVNNAVIAAFGGDLTLDTGANLITNNGVLVSSHDQILGINSAILNNFQISTSGALDDVGTVDVWGALFNNGSVSAHDDGTLSLASVANKGTITIDFTSTASQTGSLVNYATGTISNSGTYALHSKVSNIGAIYAEDGILTVDGATNNTGMLYVGTNGEVKLFSTLANSGSIQADGGVLDITGATVNSGTITIAASGHVNHLGSLVNTAAGTINSEGTYELHSTVNNSGALNNLSGSLTIDSTLLNHGSFYVGDSGDADLLYLLRNFGTVEVDGGSLGIAGGTSNSGTITASAASYVEHNAYVINSASGIMSNFGTYVVDSTVSNAGTIESEGGSFSIAGSVVNTGYIEAEDGASFTISGRVNNSGGTLVADASFLFVQSLVGGGAASIMNGGTLEFGAGANAHVTFCECANTLVLDQSSTFRGDLTNFVSDNRIVFNDMLASDTIGFSFTANAGDTGGLLRVHDTTGNIGARINIVGSDYAIADFVATVDDFGHFALLSQHDLII